MEPNIPESIRLMKESLGEQTFSSDWMIISQEETDTFAKLTNDEDPMHNDPAWAEQTEWGGTIVQAVHVLALGVGVLTTGKTPLEADSSENSYMLNYGYDRVRVIAPLRVGHRFRFCAKVTEIRPKSACEYVIKSETTVEVEGRDQPFMVYESLAFWATDQNMPAVSSEGEDDE